MSTFNFDTLYETLKTGVESTAKETVSDYLNQAKSDGQQALSGMKDNLQRWIQELESKQMTLDDLTYLIGEEKDLNEMIALKQVGLAQVQIDKFKSAIVNMITGTVLNFLKL